jgi:hypothetical protein
MFFEKSSTASHHAEKKRLLQERWASLPRELQTGNQIAGKSAIACGATHHVMERCNFSCTCCYLGPEANKTKPLPFEEVKEQLDLMRRELGHRGKVQITAGEVTLLPLEKLGRIIRYAIGIGLDPMVMSHGQRFLEEPDYLISLVSDYGLRKISIHVDTTQRGRTGIRSTVTEVELHEVRDKFANLIRHVRKVTGKRLMAASTVTVTDSNLPDVEEITRWFFRNSDAFRLLSFLPVADVGRTRKSQGSVEREGLWEQIHGACCQTINRFPLQFGHRKCNNIVPILLVKVGGKEVLLEGVREENTRDEEMLSRALNVLGQGIDWDGSLQRNILPFARVLMRNPLFLCQTLAYSAYRVASDRAKAIEILRLMLEEKKTLRLHPFLFVIHNFMSPGELRTDEGKARLDACIFKVPVDGKMISMCEMNALGIREKLDRASLPQPSPEKALAERELANS